MLSNPRDAFLREATWHGPLAPAEAIRAAHPDLAAGDVHAAAVLGDADTVIRLLAEEPARAVAPSGPYDVEPLVYLCLSKYLRLDPSRSDAIVRAATALLDAGANPNAGFWNEGEFETALYGAAGVAHHPGLTRLLLERGADPNDVEVVYHSPEGYDSRAMQLVVETGRVTPENLALMLVRKIDWHDYEGARFLLEHGVAANLRRIRGWTPLHHALARDNSLQMIALLLDHGADPNTVEDGLTAAARAARGGRSDVLALFEQRGIPFEFQGVDRLIFACTMGDTPRARALADAEPGLLEELRAMGGELLAACAGTGNPAAAATLLDLGVDPATPFAAGDGYFGIPKHSLPIHIAAWRCNPEIVTLLLARGSPVDVPDAKGRTPLALAVLACVDSYWTEFCSLDSLRALLDAGASVAKVSLPSGHPEVDGLLRRYGAPA